MRAGRVEISWLCEDAIVGVVIDTLLGVLCGRPPGLIALALTQHGQCSYHDVARLMNESEHSILVTPRSALHRLHGPLLEASTPTY